MRLTFCAACGERETDLHHYRIVNNDDEAPTNIITLCWTCHLKLYGKQKKARGKTAA